MEDCLVNNRLIFEKPKRLAGPIGWIGHIPFAFLLIGELKPKIFVELGVHSGNSYNAFCQAVDYFGFKTLCYGVDHWKGDNHAEFYDESVYSSLSDYQNDNYSPFSKLLRMNFDDAAYGFEDNSIDLLHIDGLHTYDAVKHDFEIWLPKLSKNSVVLFHDTQVKEKDFGVWKLWEELSKQYPSIEFLHSYGLGVLKTGDHLKHLLFTLNNKELLFVQSFFRSIGTNLLLKFMISEDMSNFDYIQKQIINNSDIF